MDTLPWLLDADPALRWQAMRDLTNASPTAIAEERAGVPRQGLGAAILSGPGSERLLEPPRYSSLVADPLHLASSALTGVDPTDPAIESAIARLEGSLRWSNQPNWELRPAELGGDPFFAGEVEPCINGGVLALGAYFGRPTESLARRLLSQQLPDGGWNCEAPRTTRSSFHTTICVLEGLLQFERAVGPAAPIAPAIASARSRGEEYLLQRALFAGSLPAKSSTRSSSPSPFRRATTTTSSAPSTTSAILRDSTPPLDPRLDEAISILESKRQPNGRWLLDAAYTEAIALPIGESPGQPSRWNTLRALRVLRWYEPHRA